MSRGKETPPWISNRGANYPCNIQPTTDRMVLINGNSNDATSEDDDGKIPFAVFQRLCSVPPDYYLLHRCRWQDNVHNNLRANLNRGY